MNTDHREAVDEVRAWLVSIRGGSPFLSSADGWRLLTWLDAGVPVSTIARAIERAGEARRARRARWPLGLGDASRYLKRAGSPPPPRAPVVPSRLAEALLAVNPNDPAVVALAARFTSSSGEADAIFRQALVELRTFFDDLWGALDPSEREGLLAAARTGYGDWLSDLPEATQLALVEESARDALRARYPALTADLVWTALHPETPGDG